MDDPFRTIRFLERALLVCNCAFSGLHVSNYCVLHWKASLNLHTSSYCVLHCKALTAEV